jgi:hypothetical protein
MSGFVTAAIDNRSPIAIIRWSCSDSQLPASQMDRVFGSNTLRSLTLLGTPVERPSDLSLRGHQHAMSLVGRYLRTGPFFYISSLLLSCHDLSHSAVNVAHCSEMYGGAS